ncbi:hypothetical protein [Phenylobacterium conjunctum]|uniref:Uncharacterized protein n=1 Tax=Phenylobacterium conjunctum TaxID=1298959 RepID=A0ABW3T3T3_9CAUL
MRWITRSSGPTWVRKGAVTGRLTLAVVPVSAQPAPAMSALIA